MNKINFSQNGYYRVPIKDGYHVFENLGRVKKKNDGRFEWWRWPSKFHSNWNGTGQGVSETEIEAMNNVFNGWQ